MQRMFIRNVALYGAAALSLSALVAQAAPIPVSGTWVNAVANGNGPISNQNSNSPTVGDGSANSADGEMFHSPFGAITLSNNGEFVEMTGTITLTGTVNSPLTSGNPRTQFRFGVFDDNGSAGNTGWVGYYMTNKHGNAGTPAGALAEKPTGNTSVYLSSTGSTSLASVQGDGTAASLFNDDTYTMTIKITRNGTSLDINASLTGANGFSQTLPATGVVTDATPGTFTFDSVGILLGGNLDTDQAQLNNIVINTNVPEPATAGLLAIGALALASRRRRN